MTRNSELMVDEEEVENLALALRDELVGRGYMRAIRLEIGADCPQPVVRALLENFDLAANAVYRIDGPVNLNRVVQVYDMVQRPDLKFRPFQPRLPRDMDAMFDLIRQAAVRPTVRRKTKVPKGEKKKRLEGKKRRGEIKKFRRGGFD